MPVPKFVEPSPRADVYSRVTDRIIADLAQGVRPWFKPWNAEHAAGRITRPLRANGQPYKGAVRRGFGAGFRQPVLDDLERRTTMTSRVTPAGLNTRDAAARRYLSGLTRILAWSP